MSKEKRSSRRVPVNINVDCRSEGNFLFERASDISEHGIFIRTEKPLPLGTKIQLQFHLPEISEKIRVTGEVVWINKPREKPGEVNNAGMGIRFLELSDLDRETILSAVKRLAVL